MTEVRLVDLEVIKRFSLALRQEFADAEDVLDALDASREVVMDALGDDATPRVLVTRPTGTPRPAPLQAHRQPARKSSTASRTAAKKTTRKPAAKSTVRKPAAKKTATRSTAKRSTTTRRATTSRTAAKKTATRSTAKKTTGRSTAKKAVKRTRR